MYMVPHFCILSWLENRLIRRRQRAAATLLLRGAGRVNASATEVGTRGRSIVLSHLPLTAWLWLPKNAHPRKSSKKALHCRFSAHTHAKGLQSSHPSALTGPVTGDSLTLALTGRSLPRAPLPQAEKTKKEKRNKKKETGIEEKERRTKEEVEPPGRAR